MTRADFEREVRAEGLTFDGPKDSVLSGLAFWTELQKRRHDLEYGCLCRTCSRNDPWQHVKVILRSCGFSRNATS